MNPFASPRTLHPTTSLGYPRTVLGAAAIERISQRPELGASYQPITIKMPDQDDTRLAAGSTLTVNRVVNLDLIAVQVDVPPSTTATLDFDGGRFWSSLDGKGSVGRIELGQVYPDGRGYGLGVRAAKAVFVNDDSVALDCRLWLVGAVFPK